MPNQKGGMNNNNMNNTNNRGSGNYGNRNHNMNRNMGGGGMGNNMIPQQQYMYSPQQAQEMEYMIQVQQMLATGQAFFDPNTGTIVPMFNGYPMMQHAMPMPGMMPGMMAPTGMYVPPPQVFVPGEGLVSEFGEVPVDAGVATDAPVVAAEETSEAAPAVAADVSSVSEPAPAPAAAVSVAVDAEITTAPTASAAAPAPVPALKKYVPPAGAVPSIPEGVEVKMSSLSIATDDVDAPVDIEKDATDGIQRYTKAEILAQYSGEGTVIPEDLRDFYTPADFAAGSVDGTKFCRAPLAPVTSLCSSAFGATPNSRSKSSNNLRGSSSSNNLERSTSNSSFAGGNNNGRFDNNNNRRGNNRGDREGKDREPGEIVEGDDGFVAYDGANDPAPRERSNKKNKTPAVYKSRFALDDSDPMAIVRKANAILNKLSITNFDKLSDEFLALLQSDGTTEDALRRGVEALVIKAQMEENFCFIYADLCRKIIDIWTALEPEGGTFSQTTEGGGEEGKTAETAAVAGADATAGAAAAVEGEAATAAPAKELRPMGKVFRELLLQRCQNEFEFDQVGALNEIRANAELADDERLEKEILLKKRSTGHMRFIGELYMKDLITANVMKNFCLDVLIESTQEEELVCLCKLFQTIGARIEQYFVEKSRLKKNKSKNLQNVVPAYFEVVKSIGESHASSRVRFMMKDLVDMRLNGWTARREEEKMVSLDKDKKPEFVPVVQTPYISGDARLSAVAEAQVDEWSVVPSGGKKKTTGAPSPVPTPTGGMSRSNSSATMSRSNSTSTGNLSGLDKRRVPGAASAAPSGVAAGPRREKSVGNVGKGPANGPSSGKPAGSKGANRGNSVSPMPGRDEEGAEGADASAGAANAAAVASTTAGPQSTDLSSVAKKVRSAAKEYYGHGLLEEPKQTFQELNIAPSIMPDVIKVYYCMLQIDFLCALLVI